MEWNQYPEYIPFVGTAAVAYKAYHYGSIPEESELLLSHRLIYRLNRASFLDLCLMALPILGNLALYIKDYLAWSGACKDANKAFSYCKTSPLDLYKLPEQIRKDFDLNKQLVCEPQIPPGMQKEILNGKHCVIETYFSIDFHFQEIVKPYTSKENDHTENFWISKNLWTYYVQYTPDVGMLEKMLKESPHQITKEEPIMKECIYRHGARAFEWVDPNLQKQEHFLNHLFYFNDSDQTPEGIRKREITKEIQQQSQIPEVRNITAATQKEYLTRPPRYELHG